MIDITTTLDTLTALADPPLRAWLRSRADAVGGEIENTSDAILFTEKLHPLWFKLPYTNTEVSNLLYELTTFSTEKLKRWHKLLLAVKNKQNAWKLDIALSAISSELEKEKSFDIWKRKSDLVREDGKGKNIKVGVRVITKEYGYGLLGGRHGVVISYASDKDAKEEAKESTGTIDAVRVRLDPVGR